MQVLETGIWEGETEEYYFFDSLIDDVLNIIGKDSVTDLGCGNGEYVKALKDMGIDAIGYDGNKAYLCDCVHYADLTGYPEVRQSDWAMCIEVAEHIPQVYTDSLIKTLDKANRKGIILTWSNVGDQGTGHVNPQFMKDVIPLFRGYKVDEEKTRMLGETWFLLYGIMSEAVVLVKCADS